MHTIFNVNSIFFTTEYTENNKGDFCIKTLWLYYSYVNAYDDNTPIARIKR